MTKNKFCAVAVFSLVCLFTLFKPIPTYGQLTPGTVSGIVMGNQYCPTSAGFYNPGGAYTMTCYQGTVSCGQSHPVAPITINWSVINAGATNGTVVMFGGGAGTSASSTPGEEANYVPGYAGAGYTVVQTAWLSPWEEADDGSGTYTDNVRYAACRPAGFLQYVYQNVYTNNTAGTAGMCAQGASADSAGVAYALA